MFISFKKKAVCFHDPMIFFLYSPRVSSWIVKLASDKNRSWHFFFTNFLLSEKPKLGTHPSIIRTEVTNFVRLEIWKSCEAGLRQKKGGVAISSQISWISEKTKPGTQRPIIRCTRNNNSEGKLSYFAYLYFVYLTKLLDTRYWQSCKMSQIWQIYLCKNIEKLG